MREVIDGYRDAVRLISLQIKREYQNWKISEDIMIYRKYQILIHIRKELNETILYLEGYYERKYAYGKTERILDFGGSEPSKKISGDTILQRLEIASRSAEEESCFGDGE